MAELAYNAVRRMTDPRGNWGCVESTNNTFGNGGVWRRRPNPTGVSQAVALGLSQRAPQSWYRLARFGQLRIPGGMPGPTGFAFALGGTVSGTPDGGSGIDNVVGNPAPSLRIAGNSKYARRLKVAAGARTVRVHSLQPVTGRARPLLRVMANSAVGLTADVTASSASGTGWLSITASFTASAAGAVWVVLENPEPRHLDSAWFDNLYVT